MKPTEKGIMTISILLILSSLLFIMLLFDDEILKTHRSIIALRKNYLSNSFEAQNIIQQNLIHFCHSLPLKNNKKTHKIIFKNTQKNDRTNDRILGAIWCERNFLFNVRPKKSIYQNKLNHYIDIKQLKFFQSQLVTPQDNLPKSKTPKLYWFPNTHQKWEINQDLYGVIIAENNLEISGKGKIRGVAITGGNLTLNEDVKIIYKKSVINSVIQQYSQWKVAPKSWYDFNDK